MLGLLTFLFARGLRTQFVRRLPGIVASVAFRAASVGALLTVFPADLPGEPASWRGRLHGIGFVLLMLGNLVAFVATGLALRDAPGWRRLWVYSVANAPAAVLVAVALLPFDQVAFYAAIVVMLSYYGVLGLRMNRLGGEA